MDYFAIECRSCIKLFFQQVFMASVLWSHFFLWQLCIWLRRCPNQSACARKCLRFILNQFQMKVTFFKEFKPITLLFSGMTYRKKACILFLKCILFVPCLLLYYLIRYHHLKAPFLVKFVTVTPKRMVHSLSDRGCVE